MDWQGLTIEWEIHPLTLEEGTAEIDHYWQEIHGNHIPFKLPMGLCASPVTYLAKGLLGPPAMREVRGVHLKIKITRQMYTSSRRRRHQHVHRRSPGGDPDPSDSEWESVSMVSKTSTASG